MHCRSSIAQGVYASSPIKLLAIALRVGCIPSLDTLVQSIHYYLYCHPKTLITWFGHKKIRPTIRPCNLARSHEKGFVLRLWWTFPPNCMEYSYFPWFDRRPCLECGTGNHFRPQGVCSTFLSCDWNSPRKLNQNLTATRCFHLKTTPHWWSPLAIVVMFLIKNTPQRPLFREAHPGLERV